MHSLLEIAQKPPHSLFPPTLPFPVISSLLRKKPDNVQQGLIMSKNGEDIFIRVKILHFLDTLLRSFDIGVHGLSCRVERLSESWGAIFSGRFLVVKTVKRGEKGSWTNVWVDMGKRRGRYALRQGEVRGGSEFPAVMSAITAEE